MIFPELSGPPATAILSRCAVALHSVAPRFQGFGGVSQESGATPPGKGSVAPTFSALKVASWKVSGYRGVSQLHCRLSHCSGPLSS